MVESDSFDDKEVLFNNEYSMSLRTAVDLDIASPPNKTFLDTLTEEHTEDRVKDNLTVEKVKEIALSHSQVRANSESSEFDSFDVLIENEQETKDMEEQVYSKEHGDTGDCVQQVFKLKIDGSISKMLEKDSELNEIGDVCNKIDSKCNSNSVTLEDKGSEASDLKDTQRAPSVINKLLNTRSGLAPDILVTPTCDSNLPVNSQNDDVDKNNSLDNTDKGKSGNLPNQRVDGETQSKEMNWLECKKLRDRHNSSALSEAIKLEDSTKTNEKQDLRENIKDVTQGEEREMTVSEEIDRRLGSQAGSSRQSSSKSLESSHLIFPTGVPDGTRIALCRRFSAVAVTGSRKWRFLHPVKNLIEGERSIGRL